MTTKITTTPTPLAVVDKINEVIDGKLDKTGTAAAATTLTGLTATIAELNKLDGVTATTAELNYVDGVTSNIQTQLNGKLSTSGKAASATKADTATTAGNVTGTVAVANGGTGATTAANARTNLGLNKAVTGASISGKVITLTFADGTTKTLTTQDTAPFTGSATSAGGASATKPAVVVTTYRSGANWYRIWSDGTLEQGGKVARNGTITLLKAFANTDYAPLLQCFQTGASEDYTGNINGVTTTSFTYLCAGSVSHFSWYAIGKNG